MSIRNPFQFPRMQRSPAGEAALESEGEAPRRRRSSGQAVVEFVIVLPILLMLVGGALDFGRVFYVDLKVQSATRNAAEYIATNSAFNNCQSCADFKASYLICSEMTGSADCTGATNPPRISVTLKPPKTSWPGTPRSPIVTVTVRVEQDFDMLFPYPFMSPPGRWTLVHESTFSVAQNR